MKVAWLKEDELRPKPEEEKGGSLIMTTEQQATPSGHLDIWT
jgi:hypothetical protein